VSSSKLETVTPFNAGLLRKGFFVSISFLSLRKGMRKRSPDEEQEAEFREFEDYALPKDIRNELNNLISRRQYIFQRYSIPIESMKGHFIPNANLPEVLDRASELQKDLRKLVEKIVERRSEINARLKEFHERYVRQGEPHLLPDDPSYIRTEYQKFIVRVNSVSVATSELLEAIPELRNKIRSEMMEEVNRNARELQTRVEKEIATDLKKKVAAFVMRLAAVKEKAASKGKKVNKNTAVSIQEDIKRLSALTSVNEELASLMKAVEGFALSVTSEEEEERQAVRSSNEKPAYIEAFVEFASSLQRQKQPARGREKPLRGLDVDEELIAVLKEAAK
jgi:hypothetical protein